MSHSASPVIVRLCRLAAFCVAVAGLQAASGANEPFVPVSRPRMMVDGPAANTAAGKSTAANKTDKTKTRRKQAAQTGFILIAGIAVIGVLLIVVVLLWGIRLRRRIKKRRPLPAYDPLWYLKTDKARTARPDRPAETTDREET